MTSIRWAGCLVMVAALMVTASAAQAQARDGSRGSTSAVCSFVFPAYFSPGFGLSTTTIRYGSHGETGSISCAGQIAGHAIRGTGSFGFEGTYTGNCVSNVGSGSVFYTISTDAGPMHYIGKYTESRLGVIGPINEEQPEGSFSGYHVVVPTRGDCVNAPITEALVYASGSINGKAD
jgi:hypothetical protein